MKKMEIAQDENHVPVHKKTIWQSIMSILALIIAIIALILTATNQRPATTTSTMSTSSTSSTSPTPSTPSTSNVQSSEGLYISLTGLNPMYFTIAYNSSDTAGGLLQKVATKLGVHADYVVLYRQNKAVDSSNRVVHRKDSMRIGAHSQSPIYQQVNSQTLGSLNVKDGDSIECLLRPLRGDHIHTAVSFHVHGELVDIMYDTDPIHTPFANEGYDYPVDWANLEQGKHNYHITQIHPHFGVHTGQAYWFGDGFIHSHPATAWWWFRKTEGLGTNLGAWLSQVNVAFWESASMRYPIGSFHQPIPLKDNNLAANAITFPEITGGQPTKVGGVYDCSVIGDNSNGTVGQNKGGHPLLDYAMVNHSALALVPSRILIHSNETHTWRAYYYKYYTETTPKVIEFGINEIWLPDNLALLSLSFERRDKDTSVNPPKPPQCMIDLLVNQRALDNKSSTPNQASNYYMLGFDGYPYPMPHTPKDGTGIPPKGIPEDLKKIANESRAPLL